MTALPPRLLTLGDLQDLGLSPSSVSRCVRRAELLRVRQEVYAPMPWWRTLDAEQRLRQLHIAVVLRTSAPPVFSHASATLLHRLTVLHRPRAPHVVSPPGHGSRNGRLCVRHWADLPAEHVVRVDGLRVTSIPRTVLGCAATLPLREALVVADHALRRGADREEMFALVERRSGLPGCRRARRVVELADGRCESPGETLTRLVPVRSTLPPPELQIAQRTAHGTYRGDFGWRTHRLLLEFDGDTKDFDHGPTDQALLQERKREKHLTNAGWRVLRTDWAMVTQRPEQLVELVRRELERRPPRE